MTLPKMLLPVVLSIAIAMVGNNQVIAQDFDDNNFIRYTRLEGLSNNYISGIVQDSAGYIWIATHKGLNRFDGKTFQSIFKSSLYSPLPDNLLVSVHYQTPNEIVGGTRAGSFAFDPATGQYHAGMSLLVIVTTCARDSLMRCVHAIPPRRSLPASSCVAIVPPTPRFVTLTPSPCFARNASCRKVTAFSGRGLH